MPNWVTIELMILPVAAMFLGSVIMSIIKFAKLETRVEFLEARHGALNDELSTQLGSLDGKLDGVSDRLSHIEGYMKRDRED